MLRESFRPVLIAAGASALLAALVLSVLQALWITPLILRAETYEGSTAAEPVHVTALEQHDHASSANEPSPSHEHAHEHGTHHHDADDWKPENGWQRALFTVAANIVMGFGYALLLAGVYLLWRAPKNALQGARFGLAGFVVFFVAPGLGLPPELPGTAAAELALRQQWWLSTVMASAVGLGLLFMQSRSWLRVAGVLALLAPHLIGAPQPATHASLAPAALQYEFRIATAVGNALFWIVLGTLSALLWKKQLGNIEADALSARGNR